MASRTLRTRSLIGTSLVALALSCGLSSGLSGCSLVKDPAARPRPGGPSVSPTGPVASASPTSAPIAFAEKDQRRFPEEGVRTAAVGRDVVLTMTDSTVVARSLPDLDTAYSLSAAEDRFTDLWTDPPAGVGYTLEVSTDAGSGTAVGREHYAVQRFDLETGEIAETVTATLPQDPGGSASDATARIAGVEGDRVVLDSWVPGAGSSHTAVVVDLANRARPWQARPAQVLTATDDLVVVDTGTTEVAGRVEALDLRTGRRQWAALPGTLGATAVGTTDDTVTIARDDNVFPDATVTRLRLADGTPSRPVPATAWDWSCTPTTGTVTVCTLADNDQGDADRVVGWDLATNRRVWSLPTANRFAPIVTAVRGNLVYGLLDSGQGVVLDGVTGEDVAGDTGGAPMALNDWGGVLLYDGTALFLPATTPSKDGGGDFPTESPTAPPTG
ncbi:hypothetical protein FB382_004202 [Nocardioides ginsengisegetis]|uniref:PQQ-like domain-containing protein n=1 Tax=Nocardioides ginsengisegetis TaxID=661491 RepID=A0A7W3PBV2_9ACTN|nr:hypothetical protein [Nocardioides ginsengisegetis]MBA8805857.1 hypothetical protein [Nocardioides ginsengisegetis]